MFKRNSKDHLVPRKPTSYIINVFTIEDKILPELEHLRDGILDGTISNTDTVLEGESKLPMKLREGRSLDNVNHGLTNTMNWTSPDFNPDWTTSESEKAAAYASAETRFGNIGDSFTSDNSVFGARFKRE